MRRRRFVLVMLAGMLVAPWSSGCGKKTQAKRDGGGLELDGGPISMDAAVVSGTLAFDVVAVLATDASVAVPPTNNFTLVLDVEAGQVIVGGNGRGSVVGVTTADGRTFHSAGAFSVGTVGEACDSLSDILYESVEVTIGDDSLTGTASGKASVSCGDCAFLVPFTAQLVGARDTKPPILRGCGAPPANPFESFRFVTSEPLPATATARLIADDGETVDLVPAKTTGEVPLVVAFTKPQIVLRAGHGYGVSFEGLIDFAGQTDPSGLPLRLTSFNAAPMVPEDGFESATGAALGGAMIMSAGVVPAIAGTTSLYVGSPGAPGLDSTIGRSLMIRMARQAGDTKLRFSYRVIAAQAQGSFWGTVNVGSEGASAGSPTSSFANAIASEAITVSGQTAYASAVAMMEIALPADATEDVLVVIAPVSSAFVSPPVPRNTGLLIDDLRLE